MKVSELELEGLRLIEPQVFRDARGVFVETYNAERYQTFGIGEQFVQDNYSRSLRGTVRGLHYQSHPGQAKLVRVVQGEIFDVAVDIRPNSPTFGRWTGLHLNAEQHQQLFIPIGFAHGFCVVSEIADVEYKVSNFYDAKTECGLRFNDPELNVAWPVAEPILSDRDRTAESFAAFRARVGR